MQQTNFELKDLKHFKNRTLTVVQMRDTQVHL